MHELSIAQSVLAIATEHAAGRRIHRIELRVGHLRQVVPAALEFAFELVAQGTGAEDAELRIAEVRAAGTCRTCGARSVLDGFPLTCEDCGGLDLEVVAGEELCVESIEVEDALTSEGVGCGN